MADNPDNIPLIETSAERLAKEQAEERRKENRYRKLQLWFNGILAFFAVVTGAAVLTQSWILHGQLHEMKSGGKDTHDLAVAAKGQADAAKALADLAKTQVGKMDKS